MKFKEGSVVKLVGSKEELSKWELSINVASLLTPNCGIFVEGLKEGMVGSVVFADDRFENAYIVDFGLGCKGFATRVRDDGTIDLDPTQKGHCLLVIEVLLEEAKIGFVGDVKEGKIASDFDEELLVACNIVKRGDKMVLSIITKDETYDSEMDYDEEQAKELVDDFGFMIGLFRASDLVNQSKEDKESIESERATLKDLIEALNN